MKNRTTWIIKKTQPQKESTKLIKQNIQKSIGSELDKTETL